MAADFASNSTRTNLFSFGSNKNNDHRTTFEPELHGRKTPLDHSFGDAQDDVPSQPSTIRVLKISPQGTDSEGQMTKEIFEMGNSSSNNLGVNEMARPASEPRRPRTPAGTQSQSTQSVSAREVSPPLVISPESRSASKYKNWKSTERGRTPSGSIGPLDRPAKIAYATMAGDKSYESSVWSNVKALVELLTKPLQYTDSRPQVFGKKGCVYAVRDPILDLVKIGFTTRPTPDLRFIQLRAECKLRETAAIVAHKDRRPLLAFKQLEKLVHRDLLPHRFYWDCECGIGKGVNEESQARMREHHEWYDVSDEVAIKTIDVWTNFLLQDPYGKLSTLGSHALEERWRCRIDKLTFVSETERHEHHETRLSRWTTIFESGPVSLQAPAVGPHSSATTSLATDLEKPVSPSIVKPERPEDPFLHSIPAFVDKAERKPSVPALEHGTTEHSTVREHRHICSGVSPASSFLSSNSVSSTPSLTSRVPDRDSRKSSSFAKRKVDLRLPEASTSQNMLNHQGTSATAAKNYHHHQPEIRTTTEVDGNPSGSEVAYKRGTPAGDTENGIIDRRRDSPGTKELIGGVAPVLSLRNILDVLQEKQKGLPWHKIRGDLIKFRWQFACFVIFALFSPFAPSALSVLTWSIFLPFFVAELREWV